MKEKIIKKTQNKSENTQCKCRIWIWVVGAFLLGLLMGCVVHYTAVNWNGFFATCPNGVKPDKNGCCAGETYTDAGDGWMVCCPEDGENCFPPVK